MAEYNHVLFDASTGTATPLMHARWRAKGASVGIPPKAQLTAKGLATATFRSLWAKAFPSRRPLPNGPIHDKGGKLTQEFLDVWVD